METKGEGPPWRQGEVRRWRSLEDARLNDDSDPATVRAFLQMANEEVDRLRCAVKRE